MNWLIFILIFISIIQFFTSKEKAKFILHNGLFFMFSVTMISLYNFYVKNIEGKDIIHVAIAVIMVLICVVWTIYTYLLLDEKI